MQFQRFMEEARILKVQRQPVEHMQPTLRNAFVGLRAFELAPGFHRRPIDGNFLFVFLIKRLKKVQVRQQVKKPLPRSSLLQLPGQLVQLAHRKIFHTGEVLHHAQVGLLALLGVLQVALFHRLADKVVEEVQQPAAVEEGILQRQGQRRPNALRQGQTFRAEHIQQLRLGKPAPGCPDQGERFPHQARTFGFKVLFAALQHQVKQGRDGLRAQAAIDALIQPFVAAELAQLIQQQAQTQRVGGLGVGCHALHPFGAQRFGVLFEKRARQVLALLKLKRLHRERGPAPLNNSIQGRAGQGGEHQAHTLRQRVGQPEQLACALAIFQLVQCVQHQGEPAFLGCHV